MTLRLAVENMDRLPDGGPVRVEVKGRGIDIGRDAHLDWTLPDPTRYVSGKHCEIRFRDGDYWLYDVSTNGTHLNGSQFRLDAPHRLQNGDRLVIGPYVIAATVEGGERATEVPRAVAAASAIPNGDVWGGVGEAAAPDDRDAYRFRGVPVATGDFLDFSAGVSDPVRADQVPTVAPLEEVPAADDWMTAPPPPEPPPLQRAPERVETPRPARPVEAAPPTPAPSLTTVNVVVAAPVVMPLTASEPPLAAPVAAPLDASAAALLDRIAAVAGIPRAAISQRRPDEVAEEIGAVLRLTVTHLIQMIGSRAQTKSLIRSANHTVYRPAENNPLKFSADLEHALEALFSPPNRVYLKAPAAVDEAFDDLKAHDVYVFGAIQGALDALFEDLSPDKIEGSVPQDRGLGAMVSSRKARLWDAYADRWRAMTKRSDGRLNDAFMLLFSHAYDKLDTRAK